MRSSAEGSTIAAKAALGPASLNINAAEFRPSFAAAAQAPVQAPPPYMQNQQHAPDAWSHMGFGGEDADAGQEWPANHWGAYVEQARRPTLSLLSHQLNLQRAPCEALESHVAAFLKEWQASFVGRRYACVNVGMSSVRAPLRANGIKS